MSVIERFLGGLRSGEALDPDGVTIRAMKRRDLKAGVMDVEGAAYPKPWSLGVFQSELDQMRSGTRHYLVALRGGQIVGHAGVWFTGEEAHVTNVAVAPKVRRAMPKTSKPVAAAASSETARPYTK